MGSNTPNRDKVAIVVSGGRIVIKTMLEPGDEYVPISPEEILELLPEAARDGVYVVDWSRQPAGHYSLRMVSDLIQLAAKQVSEGAAGVVLACGAQGMEEMAYLASLVWSFAQPLVFVSSTQYHTRDMGARFLAQAIDAARSCWGKRVLVLSEGELFSAADVVQTSNYRCGAFSARNCGAFGTNERSRILPIDTQPARRVEIVHSSLGGGEVVLAALQAKGASEIDGLVLAAFGDGEVAPSWTPYIKKLLRDEVPIILTSRCLNGKVVKCFSFEGSSYRLLEMGVIDGGGLSPLQARIKLALALGAKLEGDDLKFYITEE